MDGVEWGRAAARADAGVFLAAVEATGEAVLVTTACLDEPGPVIEYANPAFTTMTGYAATEVIGRSPRFLQGPGTDRAGLDRMRAALVAGSRFQGEALNYRKDGSTYTVEWVITPVREGGCLTHWVSAQRDVSERRAMEDRQTLLVRELHHRVKNTLATVQAVLNATLRSAQGFDAFRRTFTNRIGSLAKTHALITEGPMQAVTLDSLLRTELGVYDEPERGRVDLDGPVIWLSSEIAVPLGMALHELAANAGIHGALSDADGRVAVAWERRGGRLRLTWTEHDGPPPPLPTREGFGSLLLKRILTAQIGAEVNIAFDPDGLRVALSIPLPDDLPDARRTGTT